MPQWIQIYGTWFLQVCSHGLVGEVRALITINLRIVQDTHSIFHTLYLTSCDSSSKQKKVVTGLDPTFRASARDFQNYFCEGLLGAL